MKKGRHYIYAKETNFYNLYSDLMTFWHKALPNEIIDVVYEELIVDPKKQIKKLLNFCDLKWDENCVKYYNNKRIINKTDQYSSLLGPQYNNIEIKTLIT